MIVRQLALLVCPFPAVGYVNSWITATPRASFMSSTSGKDSPVESEPSKMLVRDLLQCFQGEFDNYDQVVEDRKAGMAAGPGGGHEHIHCSLGLLDSTQVPMQIAEGHASGGIKARGQDREEGPPLAVVAAKYYFNGDANVVFRYRLYSFHACPPDMEGARGGAQMRLWRLAPSVERRLRAKAYDLTAFDWCGSSEVGADGVSVDARTGAGDVAERMFGCEIYWSRGRVSAEGGGDDGVAGHVETWEFSGLMGEDDSGTWVASQNVHGLDILIKDDLRVWADGLWVNDRGFDREGNFVYGNQRGVPYKMRKVVPDGPLEWTLGERQRTQETYAEKMAAIGVIPGQRFGPPIPSRKPSIATAGDVRGPGGG